MGWLFRAGISRQDLIDELTKNWERSVPDGSIVKTNCLARCYRGGSFNGVLWSAWQRVFEQDGKQLKPEERWINCDLLQYRKDEGWGYKDMDESMHPYYYSCPLGYLDLVPIDRFGGNAEWRKIVFEHHERRKAKRRPRCNDTR